MSESDSFIQEVTEELRREKMAKLLRRYGWIGILLVLLIVGGTAYYEWRKSTANARAEAFGDAIEASLDQKSAADRRESLALIPADPRQEVLRQMLIAANAADDPQAAMAALDQVIGDKVAPDEWRDLAILRKAMLGVDDTPVAERRQALEDIAIPGRPYRSLAAEQLAYLLLEEGKVDESVLALEALISANDATEAQRARIAEVVAALGESPASADTGEHENSQSDDKQ